MKETGMKLVWLALGWLFLALGIIGLALPVVPTVPFVLLAAFCFARGSEHVYDWLISNPTFGPMIIDWQENGAISRKTKWFSTLSLIAAVIIQLLLNVPQTIILVECLIFVCVLVFIWTRPE